MRSTDAPRIEDVGRCPACGSEGARPIFSVEDVWWRLPGRYQIKRCRRCDTFYQDPQVIGDDLALIYPEAYHAQPTIPFAGKVHSDWRGQLRAATWAATTGRPQRGVLGAVGRLLARLEGGRERAFWPLRDACIPRRDPPGRALDIGCGNGFLLAALAQAGWQAEGVEWSPQGAEAARRFSGLPVHTGDFRRLDLPAGTYDLVVLSHVIEHLDQPVPALATIHGLLAPGGWAVIFAPNPLALGARLFGPSWMHWDQPRHLVLLPPKTLGRLAANVSPRQLRLRTRATDARRSFAVSRLKRRCARTGASPPRELGMNAEPVRAGDRALELLERALVAVGLPYGEEVELCFRKAES